MGMTEAPHACGCKEHTGECKSKTPCTACKQQKRQKRDENAARASSLMIGDLLSTGLFGGIDGDVTTLL